MNRIYRTIPSFPPQASQFINWLSTQTETIMVLTGNGWNHPVVGFGVRTSTNELTGSFLERLQRLSDTNKDWILGHLGYHLNSETENITNSFPREDGFGDLFFFVPEIVVFRSGDDWMAGAFSDDQFMRIEKLILSFQNHIASESVPLILVPGQAFDNYAEHFHTLLKHIQRGDIYEVNYCIDFTGNRKELNPVSVFENLNARADAPFSALYRNGNSWLMCCSPERFLAKKEMVLFSQPIKGTRKREVDPVKDEALKTELVHDSKELSENIMIVDLVRNDLSRIAERGSVNVPELFQLHTFKTVHQMISTVSCELRPNVSISDIIRATFPMGSMTGAPKISAMKLAGKHEKQSRGIYSGSVGCITPTGDFDFNVVIRSITWNSETGHVSAKAGSAITAKANPEKEYEECLLKAEAMKNALKSV